MDSIVKQGGLVYDMGLTIPNLMNIKELSRRAIAGRALVCEYEPESNRRTFRIDLEGLSEIKWQSPEQSMLKTRSYSCFEGARRRAFDALWILIFWRHRAEDEAVLDKAMVEMEEMAACARSNPVLSAKADAIIDFIKRSRLALGKSEGKGKP